MVARLVIYSEIHPILCTFELLRFCFQLLAGAKINELTKHRQTALHLAAQQDLATICSVLLENGVDFSAEDENGNNGEGRCCCAASSFPLLGFCSQSCRLQQVGANAL